MENQQGKKIYRRSAGSPAIRTDTEKSEPLAGMTESDKMPAEADPRHADKK